jgi:hypothetical protein
MASQWAAPPPGYPAGHGQAYGDQQLATPPPQAATAVAVTAASNGVGNPYVVVTPASAAPSTCQSARLNLLSLILCAPLEAREILSLLTCFVRLDASLQPSGRRWAATASCSRTEPARPPTPPATSGTTVRAPCFDPLYLSLSVSDQFANRHDTHAMASDV